MANAEDKYARHIKLADSDRELEGGEPDIRGWPVEDGAGNRAETVDDLLLNTETGLVDAIALDNGEKYPVDSVEIGDKSVYLLGAGGDADTADADELRVQRTEEELAAGTREVEAGAMRVRKRVRTDRESIEVPTRREEVSVERVPVEGEASEAEIGEDEVVMPVTEEEIVVSKRPVVKEEVRIKKDVVEDTQVVEEDVRREEIEVEDATERGSGADR